MVSSRAWNAAAAVLLLLLVGAGLASVGLTDGPVPPGYYDGDDDDAVTLPERTALVHLAVATGPTPLLVLNAGAVLAPVDPVRFSRPAGSDPPALRSPPAT